MATISDIDREQTRAGGLATAVDDQLQASIIIVVHNNREDLDACITSVLGDRFCGSEIILVDNASTDESADYIESHYGSVRVIRSRRNDGFGRACNAGAALARGRYLAFLNPDTVVEPGWLDELIRALAHRFDRGLATARILLRGDRERINTCGNDSHYSGLTLCRGMGKSRDNLSEYHEVSAVSGAAFVIRRSVFEVLGGFDDRFFLYMEDTDLSWRARLAGFGSVYVPSAVVYHDYQLRLWPAKIYYQERNRYCMLLKCYRWRTLALLSPGLLLAEIVIWGFLLQLGPKYVASKLRSYTWLGRHWHDVLERRESTQHLRRRGDRALLERCTWRLAFEQTGWRVAAMVAHGLFDLPSWLVLSAARQVVRW